MTPSDSDRPEPAPPLLVVPRRSHLAEQLGVDRRRFLAASGSALGALILAACDAQGPKSAQALLRFAERKNESLERVLFRHTSMDVPSAGATPAGTHFPAYFVSPNVPVWEEAV
ncbi:MAG TPA: hypothetical protein VK636_21030, partial [Gemmatimonadaceae bacterium]|nr:hypothetical protein [Gemmatimonadaceae bacterium]